jgi:poly(3-hydroxybutyrate) depolymerase
MSAALALRALLLLLLCAVLAVLAGLLVPMRVSAANASAAREGSLTSGGLTRTYRLYRPASLASGRPVPTNAGAGHQWPGSVARPTSAAAFLQPDPPSQALDATAALWTFFSQHRT